MVRTAGARDVAMQRDPLETRMIMKVREGGRAEEPDWVVVEEPLEIRVGNEPLAVIMRTPGQDIELAAGFALTEGVVGSVREIATIRQCGAPPEAEPNIVDIGLTPGTVFDPDGMRRNLMASAACGLCGKASLEALATRARPNESSLSVRQQILEALPERMRAAQQTFMRTGALHAAALFLPDGSLLACREDVGRHNAVDKVIGWAILRGEPPPGAVLVVSGRTSFEILQKAAVAGIPVVCAISGPTTLAIETARAFNITLVNFLRGRGMNIASCPERIDAS
jgi:FdhD protein